MKVENSAKALQVYEHGMDFIKAKEYLPAIAVMSESLDLDPTFVEAYIARGDAYTETRQYEKGLADFEAAIKQRPQLAEDPGSVWIYRDRAVCNTMLKQWPAVVADCDRIVSFDPKFAFAYMTRSIAYDNLGKLDLAKKDHDTYEALKQPMGPKS